MNAFELIERVSRDRVLFVGEEIRDVYKYVTPLGRPLKDLILSVKLEEVEAFAGGIRSTADHAHNFCADVDIWSDRTVTKARYVEQSYFRKLFQCYEGVEMNHESRPSNLEYDSICVVDYGHGMMEQQMADELVEQSPYLAVNVQANSGNYGFNLATKYDRCDYLVVDELEARLATGNQNGEIEKSLEELSYIAPKVVITLGKNGSIGWTKEGIKRCPSFVNSVTDTMGAGDAFFGVTAPMSKYGCIEDLMLIGNLAGGLKAQSVGQKAVTKEELLKRLHDVTRSR